MKEITMKFTAAVFAVLFVVTASLAADPAPGVQGAPTPQTGAEVADDGSGNDSVDCFYEANAANELCQKTGAGVAIRPESTIAPSQAVAGASNGALVVRDPAQ